MLAKLFLGIFHGCFVPLKHCGHCFAQSVSNRDQGPYFLFIILGYSTLAFSAQRHWKTDTLIDLHQDPVLDVI